MLGACFALCLLQVCVSLLGSSQPLTLWVVALGTTFAMRWSGTSMGLCTEILWR